MECSDGSNDNDKQVQEVENDHVSDSAVESDMPMYATLSALQVQKEKVQNNKVSSTVPSLVSGPTSKKNKVTVHCTNNRKDKTSWNKIHFCFYYGFSSTEYSKHDLEPDELESEVVTILGLPKKSNERKIQLMKLRNAGDYKIT